MTCSLWREAGSFVGSFVLKLGRCVRAEGARGRDRLEVRRIAHQMTRSVTPVDYEMNAAKTILFVEDDAFVLAMYRSRLQSAGFSVESVADGLAALEVLPRLRPDAVILDLMLPSCLGSRC